MKEAELGRQRRKIILGVAIWAVLLFSAMLPAGIVLSSPLGAESRARPDFLKRPPPPPCGSWRFRFRAFRSCGFEYVALCVDGKWHHGPVYFHYYEGQRWFWWHDGWRQDVWRVAPGIGIEPAHC
jgi:hypothetical protein